MKKLNIFKFDSNKKYKIIKMSAIVLVAVTAVSTLAGCIEKGNNSYNIFYNNEYNNESNNRYNNEYTQYLDKDSDDKEISSESILSNENLEKISSCYLKFSRDDFNSFKSEVSSLTVKYPYSDLYFISENLEKYNNINKYVCTEKSIFLNGIVTGEYIYEVVFKNNLDANFNDKEKISSFNLKKICEEIAQAINYIILLDKDIDLNVLTEKINNLKIKNFTGFSNGSYDSTTGVMWLDVNKLNSDISFFKKVIGHETVHLIQTNSINEINKTDYNLRLGIMYNFNNSKVNSLNWTWFSEGCAESIMMNMTNSKEALTYDNYIRIIETIKTATILSNNDVYDFEKLSLSSNLDKLFEYFSCQSEEDKIEILNMMFAYEFICGATGSLSVNQFYDFYESKYGEMGYKVETLFKKQLKGSIAQTLSKQFYIGLANNIINNEVSIIEIFDAISIYESEMNKLTWYSATGISEDINEFITNYVKVQNEFFELLSKNSGLTEEEITNAYITYNSQNNNNISEISFLSEFKIKFYNDVKTNRQNDRTNPIRHYCLLDKKNIKIR